jgi:teichuronic acid biosynthesis protein TuaE
MVKKSDRIQIIDAAFYLMVIASFFGTISLMNTPIGALTPVRIALIIVLFTMAISRAPKQNLKYFVSINNIPFWFLPVFASMSMAWTVADKALAFNHLLNIITGLTITSLCIVYTDSHSKLQNYWLFFRIGCWLQVIIGVIEITFGWRISTSIFEQASTSEYAVQINRFTPTGLSGNPNTLAFILGFFIIHLLIYKEENTIIRFTGIMSTSIILMLTDARSVMLSLLLILALHFFNSFQKSGENLILLSIKILLIVAMGLTIGGFAISLISGGEIWDKLFSLDIFASLGEGSDQSNTTAGGIRKDLARLALTGLFERFLLGAGVGGTIDLMKSVNTENLLVTNPHNFWIELLTDYGIIPFSLLMYWFCNIFMQLHQLSNSMTKNSNFNHLVDSSQAMIIYMILAGTAPSSLSSVWVFYIVLGLLVSTVSIGKQYQ